MTLKQEKLLFATQYFILSRMNNLGSPVREQLMDSIDKTILDIEQHIKQEERSNALYYDSR